MVDATGGPPRLNQLGANRLGLVLLTLDVFVLIAVTILFAYKGITLVWSTVILGIALLSVLIGLWGNFVLTPGRQKEWFLAELVFVVTLIVFLTNVASPFQYGAIALGFPFADPWLAASDAALGVNLPELPSSTATHPTIATILKVAYGSFMPQMFVAIGVLAARRDRARIWEFAFHFHFCLILCVGALVLFPAVCPPAYYRFTPAIDMTLLIRQINRLHDGSMRVVRFDELEGLVSFPSFHVAGALIATWAMRGRSRWFIGFVCLNVVMIASTFVTGVHYLIDVIASLPLFGASVVTYNRYCAKWIDS